MTRYVKIIIRNVTRVYNTSALGLGANSCRALWCAIELPAFFFRKAFESPVPGRPVAKRVLPLDLSMEKT